jgi:hypothetical protein
MQGCAVKLVTIRGMHGIPSSMYASVHDIASAYCGRIAEHDLAKRFTHRS